VDRELAAWLDALRDEPGPPAREIGAEALRRGSRDRAATRPRGPELAIVEPRAMPGDPPLGGRLYRPALAPRPLVVFLHGGMWLLGDLDTHDRTCRRLAAESDVAVLAVDYRLAPEHPWPAAVDDAVRALRWTAEATEELGGRAGVAVAGDSAGAHLAALACLRLRDAGDPQPTVQALAYPNTDLTLSQPSVREKGTGWSLDADDLAWAVEQWVPDADLRADGAVSPLHAADLSRLPPALVVTAEHDPLHDEGDRFAARLKAAGTPVRHRCEPGLVHGFLQGLDLVSPVAAAASDRFFADVRELVRDER
jgi:acetyl esterase